MFSSPPISRRTLLAAGATTALAALTAPLTMPLTAAARRGPCNYDGVVLQDSPAAYWRLAQPGGGTEASLGQVSGLTGSYAGTRSTTTLPNGDAATAFDGATGYFQVADHAALSPATTGVFTLEAWMRPDALEFPNQQGSGYVHWMGKGEAGQHEYVSRMYSRTNTENRPNRISGYSFNLTGGLGAGSYFQDPVAAGTWIHYVLVINAATKSTTYPNGYTKIYRDGVLRDQDDLSIQGQIIVPARGSAPFRAGTRDLGSFFQGAIGKLAVYPKELTPTRIAAHHTAMVP
ncbi:LamG domain-containing protein [Kribbella sp. CA-293567]|uniref:LamG domain-containing protein n=1 Tax=Kribbella sp. CA-293567 TaxID=3002436 RepID=UPI0022DE3528|nr:LamG domain-containing protein [Kribbella sp. CA-293567]WBQ06072.1 LamG domain-containing protein [Kribbella sp. CA-293567]